MIKFQKRYKIGIYLQWKTSRKSYMAYQMAATAVTLDGLDGYSPVAGLNKCNSSTTCAAFYKISTDSVLARSLGDSRASCLCMLSLVVVPSSTGGSLSTSGFVDDVILVHSQPMKTSNVTRFWQGWYRCSLVRICSVFAWLKYEHDSIYDITSCFLSVMCPFK